jgi:uncharacterized protein
MPLGKIFKFLTGGFDDDESDDSHQDSESTKTEESELAQVVEQTAHLSLEINEIPSLIVSEKTEELLPEIPEKKVMINVSMLQDVLQNFVSSSPDVQGAILASPDGLALASVLASGMDEERTAAMSASMLSLGERIGRELARGSVERLVFEGEKGYGVLVSCGLDAVLLVLASAEAKQGLLFLEVKRTAAKITPLLG